jgi:hypothetical protein
MRLAENERSEWPKGHYRFEALVELSQKRRNVGFEPKFQKRSALKLDGRAIPRKQESNLLTGIVS